MKKGRDVLSATDESQNFKDENPKKGTTPKLQILTNK